MRCPPASAPATAGRVAALGLLVVAALGPAGRMQADEAADVRVETIASGLAVRACRSSDEAERAARALARRIGGWVVQTSGTRSMEPLIQGRAYAVVRFDPYEAIRHRDVLLYLGRPTPGRPQRIRLLHRAVLRDRYGWIMSGDNNRRSEVWDRVTRDNYLGRAVMIFTVDSRAVARR